MPLDARELDNRVKKLRKILKNFPKNPAVDEVHHLRTRTRHVESILEALEMDSSRNGRKLLAGLQSVRKRAGKVRDMDVLTSDVIGLGVEDDPDCVVRLVHYLGDQRRRHAGKLYSTVKTESPQLQKRLKRSRRRLGSIADRFAKNKFALGNKKADQAAEPPVHAMSEALRLSKELAAVPRLGTDNLHTYRIEVKRLRYLLEMARMNSREQKSFIEELKHVQDAVGDWHDWVELSAIAHDLLEQHRGCKLVSKIEDTRNRKFKGALRVTEQMRQRYLPAPKGGKKPSRGRQGQPAIPGPVLVATSEIAA